MNLAIPVDIDQLLTLKQISAGHIFLSYSVSLYPMRNSDRKWKLIREIFNLTNLKNIIRQDIGIEYLEGKINEIIKNMLVIVIVIVKDDLIINEIFLFNM